MQDTCIAGLWLRDLPNEMMWQPKVDFTEHTRQPFLSFRPKGYRAPSWSWASVEGSIAFNDRYLDRGKVSNFTILSTTYRMLDKVIDEDDYTMQAEYGSIHLQGGLVDGHMRGWWSERMRFLHPANASTSLHTTEMRCIIDDYARHSRPKNVSFLPINTITEPALRYAGLVLIPTPGDCFRRIGTFHTHFGSVNVPISNDQGKLGDAEYPCKVELQEISFEDMFVDVCHEGNFGEQEKRIITLI
jgi:hypothetical protein